MKGDQIFLRLIIFINIISLLISCSGNNSKTGTSLTRDSLIKNAPVLSPEDFIRFTNVQEGFELQVVASEPDIIAPVSMIFDNKNRIWAVEMTSYMPDTEGDGENTPNGKVVILEDRNKDGYYEKRKVFLDSLFLPRSIAFIDKGILVAEPPNLWYYEIQNNKPQNKTLVDSKFTEGFNVELQSNGLLRGVDNWIYNAGTDKRYKKTDTGWVIQKTQFRGQWGITRDDEGRLFYNNNSQNLLGDYFLPGLGNNNSNLPRITGFNERIVRDNSTFPIRPTPGVNRGYSRTEVDDSLRLKTFTAACGPVIYRGDLFGDDYYQNAFVAEPAGNLIKRNILHYSPDAVYGEQAYRGKEFIASDDERFRPVNLYNGPDGALYIVDMYRGIIQYKLMITRYLQNEIKERGLDKPLNCGRIYRVVPKGTKAVQFIMPESPVELIRLFRDKNSWRAERAQQILVDTKPAEIVAPLKKILDTTQNLNEFIRSLWTLRGMNSISDREIIQQIDKRKNSAELIQLYTALKKLPVGDFREKFISRTSDLIKDSAVAVYIAFKSYLFKDCGKDVFIEIQDKLLSSYPASKVIAQAVVSNSQDAEVQLLNRLKKEHFLNVNAAVYNELDGVIKHIEQSKSTSREAVLRSKYGRGIGLFKTTCQPCHGADGEGIKNLAPPLNNSEWVMGNKENLISIVLYGLTGPVAVHNKLYDVPEVSGEMPGVLNNPEMVEPDLALLLSYIRNNWNNRAGEIKLEDIKAVKKKWGDRATPFTIGELLNKR